MVYHTAKQNHGLSYCKIKPWFIILQNKTMVYHTAKQNLVYHTAKKLVAEPDGNLYRSFTVSSMNTSRQFFTGYLASVLVSCFVNTA